MIVVGGVTLDNNVLVDGLKSSDTTTTTVENTIGGEAYIISSNRVNVPVITFTSDADYGWQSEATVNALIAIEQLGGVQTVNVNGDEFLALFTGGFTAEKVLRTIPDGEPNDYYTINFSMVKVS